ncbi:hypothetical protein QQS21_000278 [Conoideocrella luteorostrata]|uniref:Cytochrome P450 n=1 Tax=Conoideocrella luteorostrata TaxID=1105319 RepID=A0AAJ0D064_9HYPO|nr:hypothetical protein QQS21_000278 [Conoideocrella luteorostrata]
MADDVSGCRRKRTQYSDWIASGNSMRQENENRNWKCTRSGSNKSGAVLVTKFDDFEVGQRRRDNSKELLGIGVFNADGHDWEYGRALVKPNFTRKQVANLDLFETHFQHLLDHMPADGTVFDFQERAFRFTMDTGTEMLLGYSSNLVQPSADSVAERFAWAYDKGTSGIAQRIRLGKFARFYIDREYSEACRYVHDYVDNIVAKVIDDARTWHKERGGAQGLAEGQVEEGEERYTFLNALARDGVGAKEIRDQALNTLVAARDSSACLMSAAVFELARRPEYQAKLRQEVQDQLNGRLPTFEDLKHMTWLNRIIKETLRMYPPVPLNTRVAKRDTVLPRGGGKDGMSPIFIRAGQLIVYQVFSMHRREDIWGSDAHQFCPERWEKARPTFEYLPFNAGQRICPELS